MHFNHFFIACGGSKECIFAWKSRGAIRRMHFTIFGGTHLHRIYAHLIRLHFVASPDGCICAHLSACICLHAKGTASTMHGNAFHTRRMLLDPQCMCQLASRRILAHLVASALAASFVHFARRMGGASERMTRLHLVAYCTPFSRITQHGRCMRVHVAHMCNSLVRITVAGVLLLLLLLLLGTAGILC